tara:strand:+ start:3194 stop:4183 length:990 start_codon:yes stop_codon:yes gene_type:complete
LSKNQKYIFIIIAILICSLYLLSKFNYFNSKALPSSIGDPLELLIVKNSKNLDDNFFIKLNDLLTTDIGPAPQKENFLNLIEVYQEDFKGILQRHQNILIVSHNSKFNIRFKMDLFALDQLVIFVECPSIFALQKNKDQIIKLIQKIKSIEIKRLSRKFKQYTSKSINEQVENTHNILITPPKDFFLAYSDSTITWIRRETPKISQGIFLSNLASNKLIQSQNNIISIIDSIIKPHIFGPVDGSYMKSENDAVIKLDSIKVNDFLGVRIQSLWRMENDFMGGIFTAYYLTLKSTSSPLLIYTYLYAPGERKNVSLLQLEAIISTLSQSK